jgi:hypothetical protein
MTQFLVTDTRKLATREWIEAPSAREALIAASNRWHGTHLPASSKASHYSNGPIVDISMADVSIVGQRQSVIREA